VQTLLLRLLNEYGLSQGQVDRETGIPQTRVSRYARGHVPRGADDVFKLIELEKRLEKQAAAKKKAEEKATAKE
jgi:predicted transcriptional regulator